MRVVVWCSSLLLKLSRAHFALWPWSLPATFPLDLWVFLRTALSGNCIKERAIYFFGKNHFLLQGSVKIFLVVLWKFSIIIKYLNSKTLKAYNASNTFLSNMFSPMTPKYQSINEIGCLWWYFHSYVVRNEKNKTKPL